MNNAKLKILEETFKNKFDIEKFKKFTREFFNEPEMIQESRRTGIWREYEEHVAAYYRVAKYTDCDENNMIVLAVELKKNKSVERARSMQRNFISKVLDENNLEAAIVAFYSQNEPNWRLSFVRLDYSFTDKGIELDLTPARRYSYLVGENEPNHTAQAQLLRIFEDDTKNPTLDEIEAAFSVEKVTKEFFTLYKDKYLDLKEHLETNEAFIEETEKLGFEVHKFSEQFAKKLMGQLAFLYFLQKKGWLGVRIMPQEHSFSDGEFKDIYKSQDQAHQAVLQKVFIKIADGNMKLMPSKLTKLTEHEAGLLSDCFAKTKYDMPWGSGNRAFIREIFNFCIKNTNKNFFKDYLEPFFYEALNTKRKNHYYHRFNCKIPFLNGGLFEPLEDYHWQDVDFQIPNDLFSNEQEKGKRDADGILDIFDRFNFTMNEDEPLEKEVAVDPEMLGKIFENLLEVSDRKSKGAFYTPREIVHYMCQESLINYLVNEVNVPYEDMKEFILYGELIKDADKRRDVGYRKEFTIKKTIFDNIVKIDDALKNVKIADPAVGSGAFPLGMLNEIVKARNNITEYIIRIDKEGSFDREYGEDFIRKWRLPYKMKIDTIQNSLFAVDIEPSAVDIAKLRLWLAIVVDQEIDEENPEPHPLPNLDYNIKVGNSLIDEYEGIKLFDRSILYKHENGSAGNKKSGGKQALQISLLIDHTEEMLKEMFELQERYFAEDNETTKKELKAKIDNIRDKIIRYKLQREGNTEGLKRYEESLKNKTKPYFIWELEFAKVFRDNGGFDIVIGNPPYVRSREIDKKTSEKYKRKYKYTKSGYDLATLFIELGMAINSINGCLTYILTNKIFSANYAKHLRKYLCKKQKVKKVINLYSNLFESTPVETSIIIITNNNSEIKYNNYIKRIDNRELKIETPYTLRPKVLEMLPNYIFIFPKNDIERMLLKKLSRYNRVIEDYYKISSGYGITGIKDKLRQGKKYSDDIPVYTGKSVWVYQNLEPDYYIVKSDAKNLTCYSSSSCLLRELSVRNRGTIIKSYEKYICLNSITIVSSSGILPVELFLGIFNSKLFSIIYSLFYESTRTHSNLRYKAIYLNEIPFPNVEKYNYQSIIDCVNEILMMTNTTGFNNNTNLHSRVDMIEKKLDFLVYDLFEIDEVTAKKINSMEVSRGLKRIYT